MMSEFLTIGEPIALFASEEPDQSLEDATRFRKFLAGAEVNVAVGVSRLGHSSQYITRLGEDPFGKFIENSLEKNHIGTDYVDSTPKYWTAFQLKQRVTTGDPGIFYFRKGSAAAHFDKRVLDRIDFSTVKHIHLSGIFPALSAKDLDAFKYLIELGNRYKIRTTFDPNLRPQLWASEKMMVQTINELAYQTDIVMPGTNEGKVLVGSDDPETIADFYLDHGVKMVIVKVGPRGAYAKTKDKTYFVEGFKVDHVVDTVGAGDGFAVGFITGQLEGLSIEQSLRRGNAVGALAVQDPGDSDGYPTPAGLKKFLAEAKLKNG
jgi:2-dehydro-3-deoxygluconokinase